MQQRTLCSEQLVYGAAALQERFDGVQPVVLWLDLRYSDSGVASSRIWADVVSVDGLV